jgi:hypothetical protein
MLLAYYCTVPLSVKNKINKLNKESATTEQVREAIMLEVIIFDVLCSKLGRDTDNPHWSYLSFPQSLQVTGRIVFPFGQDHFLLNHYQFISN